MLDLIIGRRELGKTTLAVSLCRHFSTRVIFDPRHMIKTSPIILYETSQVRGVLYELLNEQAEIIVRPNFDVDETFDAMCGEIYRWLKDNPGEPFCLLIDEVRFLEAPEQNSFFDHIVRCVPRSDVTVVLTCHRLVDLATDLRAISDYWLIFRLTLAADMDRVRERCGEEVAVAVENLNPFEYVIWDDSKGVWKIRTDKETWKVDLDKIPVTA
jgi:hypothetical protein